MFEKEAEEYANNWKINKNNDLNFAELVELRAVLYKANKDGAEFGYKKGQSDQLVHKQYQLNQLRKANEWNRVDKGKYPSKEQLGKSFIVAFGFNERKQEYYSFDCAEYIDKGKFCTHTNNDDKVIAWCEIPKYTGE